MTPRRPPGYCEPHGGREPRRQGAECRARRRAHGAMVGAHRRRALDGGAGGMRIALRRGDDQPGAGGRPGGRRDHHRQHGDGRHGDGRHRHREPPRLLPDPRPPGSCTGGRHHPLGGHPVRRIPSPGRHRLPGALPLPVARRCRHRRVRSGRRPGRRPATHRVSHRQLGARDHRAGPAVRPLPRGVHLHPTARLATRPPRHRGGHRLRGTRDVRGRSLPGRPERGTDRAGRGPGRPRPGRCGGLQCGRGPRLLTGWPGRAVRLTDRRLLRPRAVRGRSGGGGPRGRRRVPTRLRSTR